MTRIVSRFVLTILLFPLVLFASIAFVFFVSEVLRLGEEGFFFCIGLSAASFVFGAGYFLVWRGVVKWTPRRRRWTLYGTAGLLVAFLLFTLAVLSLFFDDDDWQPLIPFGAALFTLAWVSGCTILWQESWRERAARLAAAGLEGPSGRTCPACNYDLSGLSNLRCPECGAAWTLGKILDEHKSRTAPPSLD